MQPFKIIAVLLVWLTSACAMGAGPMVVRTISQDGYSGKFNIYNLERPGMMVEMMHAVERLDPGVRFSGLEQSGPMARAEIGLENGSLDIFFGMARTESRAEKFLFVDPPLYQTAYQLAARADEPSRINNLDDVRALGAAGIILINSDETNAEFLRAQGGLSIDASATNTILNLKKLVLKRGRFYFASSLSLASEIRELDLTRQVKILPPKFQQSNIYAVFSRSAPAAMVERIVADLARLEGKGELNKIRKKYLEFH